QRGGMGAGRPRGRHPRGALQHAGGAVDGPAELPAAVPRGEQEISGAIHQDVRVVVQPQGGHRRFPPYPARGSDRRMGPSINHQIGLMSQDIIEKLDGKKAKATMVEVTLAPGEVEAAHRHPGAAFGYVLEGEYEWAIDGNKPKIFKAGDTFYEPTGC